jgi:GNAT superfamily N-acetyltransferase
MPAMAISELRIAVKSSLSSAELDDLDALMSEARWNQIAADWRLFIELGRVYAAHTAAGRIMATTATLPYGGRFAWISMVLVAGPYRRRGLATMLMRRAMEDLSAARLVPVLDATPDGRPVYRALGFADCWGLHRLRREQQGGEWQGERKGARPGALQGAREEFPVPGGITIRPIAAEDWPALCAFDAAAFGAQRSAVLGALRGRLPAAELVAVTGDRILGFSLGRDGRIAAQIGPLVAESDTIACAILSHALAGIDTPLFIDLADAKPDVRIFLEGRGFAAVRPFTRMLHGRSARFDDPVRTFAVVGPEFG